MNPTEVITKLQSLKKEIQDKRSELAVAEDQYWGFVCNELGIMRGEEMTVESMVCLISKVAGMRDGN